MSRLASLIFIGIIITCMPLSIIAQEKNDKKTKRKIIKVTTNGGIVDGNNCLGTIGVFLTVSFANLTNHVDGSHNLPSNWDSIYIGILSDGEIIWKSKGLSDFDKINGNDRVFEKTITLEQVNLCGFSNNKDSIINYEVCFLDDSDNKYFTSSDILSFSGIGDIFESTYVDSASNCFKFSICCPGNSQFYRNKKPINSNSSHDYEQNIIFPNPCSSTLNINFPKTNVKLDLYIYSSNHTELVLRKELLHDYRHKINVSKLEGGLYYLILKYGDTKKVYTFIKL